MSCPVDVYRLRSDSDINLIIHCQMDLSIFILSSQPDGLDTVALR